MIDSPRVCIQVQSIYGNHSRSLKKSVTSSPIPSPSRNLGRTDVQLLGRYWLITNSNGRQTEVQGEGVIGEQPVIPPGGEFQYTSGAILETPLGTMEAITKWWTIRVSRSAPLFRVPFSHSNADPLTMSTYLIGDVHGFSMN